MIDSGNWSAPWDGAEGVTRGETWTHDKDRCPDCGGGITHTITEDNETILREWEAVTPTPTTAREHR